jgi:hypothetical protein
MDPWPILIGAGCVLLVTLVVIGIVLSVRHEKRRLASLQQWAQLNQWQYTPRPAVDWGARLPGRDRRGVSLALSGIYDGYPVSVADYSYTETSTSTSTSSTGMTTTSTSHHTHHFIVVVVRLRQPGPAIAVEARHGLSKLGRALFGDGKTATGYAPFDRDFRISTKDPAAARYLVGPILVGEHLAGRVPPWSLYGTELMTFRPGRLRDPATIPDLVAPLIRVADFLGR